MGRSKALVVLSALLFISQLVAAGPAHKEYDKAELETEVLVLYIEDSFTVLYQTILSLLSSDIEGSVEGATDFSNNIEDAQRTLEGVPKDVDSYDFLNLTVQAMSRTDEHLHMLVEGNGRTFFSVEELSSYNFETWEPGPVSDNLTRADNALIEFDEGTISMETGRSLLVSDMEFLKGIDLSNYGVVDINEKLKLDPIISLLEDVEETISMIENNRSSVDEVIKRLMKVPISNWDLALKDLINETKASRDLSQDLEIIDGANHDLSLEMEGKIDVDMANLSGAWSETLRFEHDQVRFLNMITILEEDIETLPSERMIQFENCLRSLDEMIAARLMMNDHRSELTRHDTGAVILDLLLLEDLLETYSDRLGLIDIWVPDLQSISADLGSAMWENAIDADVNDNGTIERDEASALDLDIHLLDLIGNATGSIEEIKEELSRMPPGYFQEINRAVPLLEKCLLNVDGFSIHHMELASAIRNLSGLNTRSEYHLELLDQALFDLASMQGYLSGAVGMEDDLQRSGITFDTGWEEPLIELLSLYESYLLSLTDLVTEPVLKVILDRNPAPYDSLVGFTIFAIDIDPLTGPFFPNDREVNLTLDEGVLGIVVLKDGYYHGSLMIERNLTLGPHALNASMMNLTGNLTTAERVLVVRKIISTMFLSPISLEILLGESTFVDVEVRNEDRNPISALVDVSTDAARYPTPGVIPFHGLPLGNNTISVSYSGDDHHLPSEKQMLISVMQEPVLSIVSNGDLFGWKDTIDIGIHLIRGNGSVSILFNEVRRGNGKSMTQGSSGNITLDPRSIGNGTFLVKAFLMPDDGITLEGLSNTLILEIDLSVGSVDEDPIVEPPDEPPEEPPDDENDTRPEKEPPEGWDPPGPLTREGLYWALFILSVLAVIPLSLLIVIRRRRDKKRKEIVAEPFHLPRLYFRPPPRTEEEGDKETEVLSAMRKPRVSDPVEIDREELIKYYLELIERSPHELGLTRSLTPREVKDRLVGYGLDQDIATRLVRDFEWSIYKLGSPEKETLVRFKKDQGRTKGWLNILLSRLRALDEKGPDGTGGDAL